MNSVSQTTSGAALHAFVRGIIQPGEQLYGVVDSARDRHLAEAAWERFDLQRWSLFDPNADPSMATVAPYLVAFGFRKSYPYPGSGYLDLWSERLGTSAGILLISSAHPRAMWDHLRGIFLAADEQGNEYFFRYYDPRVLRVFLPTCDKNQASKFFGPMRDIVMESETPSRLLICTCETIGVKIVELPLSIKMGTQVGQASSLP